MNSLVEFTPVSVGSIVTQGIARLSNSKLRSALDQALADHGLFSTAQSCLNALVESGVRGKDLIPFFNSWRATHFTSDVTAAIAHSLARSSNEQMQEAASCIETISSEDDGDFGGEAHGELFDRLAGWACQRTDWKNAALWLKCTHEFNSWLTGTINSAAESPEAIAATLAFELFHRGECELAASVFTALAEQEYALPADAAGFICEYPIAHSCSAPEINKNNLLEAERALELFYASRGKEIDIPQVCDLVCKFYSRLDAVFSEATECFLTPCQAPAYDC